MDKRPQNRETCAESAPETWLETIMRFTPASIALAVMLTTGVLLVASKPLRYYLSDAFRLKIALLALGVAAYVWLDRRVRAAGDEAQQGANRILAVALLLTWLGVGLAGRFIGLL